jgi:hypothetical protein
MGTIDKLIDEVLELDKKATDWIGHTYSHEDNRRLVEKYRTAAPELARKLKIAKAALELSHKCHANLYLASWGHVNLKPEDDLSYLEVSAALKEIEE